MDAARWEQVQALFHEVLALPQAERPAWLEAHCAGDDALVSEVLALLEEDARGSALLDQGVAHAAHQVFGDAHALESREFGAYRITSVLGEGGMGVVYLAERSDLGSRAAIKILRDAWLSPARRERFAAEQRTLAQLNHPSIARLYDADSLPDGTPWFVMEYVEGMPITEYCRARASTVPERLRLFRDVCEAVQHAHRHLVVHRDLKPSNVLVQNDGSVKLLDFGIAKQLDSLEASADQTRTSVRLMTPAYAAPEQIRGARVGLHTDVYALGVMLYELLATRLPFDLSQHSPTEVDRIILEREPEKPSAAAARMAATPSGTSHIRTTSKAQWADLDVLCLTAMQKDPQRRYRTVEALIRDVDHYLRAEPLEARPDTLRYRTGKFLRRNVRPVAAAAVMIVTLLGLVSFYTVRLADQRNRAQIEAAKASQVSEYLIGLFEASDPFATGGDEYDVRTLLSRGVARVNTLTSQPDVQAQMYDVLGRVYVQLSQLGEAEPLIRQGLALRRAAGDPLGLGESLATLGRFYMNSGQLDSAETYLREALALREQALPEDHPAVAVNLSDLGVVLATKGQYEPAEAAYLRALEVQRKSSPTANENLGHTLQNLATNYLNQGNYEAAETYYREALSVDSTVYGPEHPVVAMELANLGSVLENRQQYAAAEALLLESLRIRRLKLGTEHYHTAYGLIQLGSLMRKQQAYDRAETYLREALAIDERVLGPEHLHTGVAASRLGLTLMDQGNHAAAEPLLRRALAVFRKNAGDRHYYTASSVCNLAYLLQLRHRNEEAEALFREGLPLLEASVPPGHPDIAVQRGRFGALLAALSNWAEAEPLLIASYENLNQRLGAAHRDTREAAGRLVQLYEAWQRPERATPYRPVAGSDTRSD